MVRKNALSTLAVENSSDWITLPLDVLHPGNPFAAIRC